MFQQRVQPWTALWPKTIPVPLQGLLALATALAAWGLVYQVSIPIPLVALGVLFVWLSINDWIHCQVPNWATYPLIVVALVRAVIERDVSWWPYWFGAFFLYQLHFFAGGDLKILVGLFGLFPDPHLLYVIALGKIVLGGPYLVYKYARQWRTLPQRMIWRAVTFQVLPSAEELRREGKPYVFSTCLSAIAYWIWLFYGRF